MKRPLILAAVVALAIGLLTLGAAATRDAAPSTHAQGAATPTPTTSPTASPSPSPSPAASPAASPVASPTTTTSSTASSTPTCNATTLGEPRRATGATSDTALAKDCDTLLGLRYTLSRPETLNWSVSVPLTSWNGVTVTPATPARMLNNVIIVAAKPARVTNLELAPYAFRGALTRLATLDALVELKLTAYTTPDTTTTPTTPDTDMTPETTPATTLRANPPACSDKALGGRGQRAANPQLAADCDTLLAIKSTLAQKNRDDLHPLVDPLGIWNWDAALSEWGTVTVSGTPKRVTELRLQSLGLKGIIPTQIGDLTGLKVLDLSGNQLTGSIPTQIGKLTALTELKLSGNQLGSGPPTAGEARGVFTDIPTQIGYLTKLTTLDLSHNRLWGHIPTQLGNLLELTTLDLSGAALNPRENTLTGKIPTQLGKLTKLKVLNLRGNRLGGDFTADAGYGIPTQLGNLTALTKLDLAVNFHLSGPIPTQLGDLVNLAQLRLNVNRLSGPLPTQLGNLAQLTLLQLANQQAGNQLSGSIPTQLGSLAQLRAFVSNRISFTGCAPGNLLSIANPTLNLPACPATTN